MLFPEAAKRGIALIAVAVAAPLQAGMWVSNSAIGDSERMSTRDSYGVRLLDTELAAPVLPAPTTATEQQPLVAEPSTGSATSFSAERVLQARLERAAPDLEGAIARYRTPVARDVPGARPQARPDLDGLTWQAF